MDFLRTSPEVLGVELASLAMSIHQIAGRMPVVAMGRNKRGILIENGDVYNVVHESIALKEIFTGRNVACLKPKGGRYAGMPIYASAIIGKSGEPVAAIGLIDTHGLLDIKSSMDDRGMLEMQVQK